MEVKFRKQIELFKKLVEVLAKTLYEVAKMLSELHSVTHKKLFQRAQKRKRKDCTRFGIVFSSEFKRTNSDY